MYFLDNPTECDILKIIITSKNCDRSIDPKYTLRAKSVATHLGVVITTLFATNLIFNADG